jgi:acetate---CoA ligase (ADP-forming)
VSRDLRSLFDPRSVAVVGASGDPTKWGHWLAAGALAGEHRRSVYLINRRGGEVLGRRAYASLAELPEAPELVVLSVPVGAFERAVEESLEAGARALVGITAGLGESGEEGRRREQQAVAAVRERGAVLVGPNCLGVFDAGSALRLVAWADFPSGEIGLVSQSGNLALEISRLAEEAGLGFSRFVSIGNQADLDAAELVDALAAHEATRLIALYCEDFREGRAFVRAAAAAGKPVVLLSAGGSPVGARAALSHTGALVSAKSAVEAACRAARIVRVRTPAELVQVAQVLLGPPLRGRRVAVVADGGGHGVVAADLATDARLEVPRLSEGLAERVAEMLPPSAETSNPVDFAGGGEQDVRSYERVIRLLLDSGEVDAALLTGYFGGYSEEAPALREQELEAAARTAEAVPGSGRPLVVHTMYADSAPAARLREGGIPVYRTIEAAVSSLARAVERALSPPIKGAPQLPELADPPLTGEPGYWEARDLLAGAGIELSQARRARTLDEARTAAAELGFPVVLKATGLRHKSDEGGVVLGIDSADALERAFLRMPRLDPPDYSVERAAPLDEGVELVVGVRRDARFGPIVLVGIGGVLAELLADVAVALAPVDAEEAEGLLRSLRGAPLLLGLRGRPAVDLGAAARAAAVLSRVAAAHPEIAELELNPLLVTAGGALGLDARVVVGEDEGQSAR